MVHGGELRVYAIKLLKTLTNTAVMSAGVFATATHFHWVTAINFILPSNLRFECNSNLPNIQHGPNTYLPFIEQVKSEY